MKDLSRWPVEDYYNIWVVHKIGSPIEGSKGYAYLPGVSDDLDGAVVLFSAFGKWGEFAGDTVLEQDTKLNKTLTHITGHYLDLYDSYEGDMGGTQCPDNSNCELDGDKCCDTPPHIRSNGDCNVNGTNPCANDSSNIYFVHNYMDASSEECKSEFTLDQSVRMWDVLNYGWRKKLKESNGCDPDCGDFASSFEVVSSTTGITPIYVEFDNTSIYSSIPIERYSWTIEGTEVATTENLVHPFDTYGTFEVCLYIYSENDKCTDFYCEEVIIQPEVVPPNPCEIINNWSFEEFSGVKYEPNDPRCQDLTYLKNWTECPNYKEPWYCASPSQTTYLGIREEDDGFCSTDELSSLKENKMYEIKFDYSVQKTDISGMQKPTLRVSLIRPIFNYFTWSAMGTIIILNNLDIDYPSTAGYEGNTHYFCFTNEIFNDYNVDFDLDWNHYTHIFKYDNPNLIDLGIIPHLYIFTENNDGFIIYIDNVSISECPIFCQGVPEITEIEKSDCAVDFYGKSTKGETEYIKYWWDFGDGTPIMIGDNVHHEYKWDGTYNVCFYMDCGSEVKSTCQEVTVSSNCESCRDYGYVIEAQQCSEGDSYIANFPLRPLEPGYVPCNENGQFMYSNQADIEVKSYLYDEQSETMNISIEITPNGGVFGDDITSHITLCPKDGVGDPICYNLFLPMVGNECDNCIQSNEVLEATCDQSKTTEDTYTYMGSYMFPPGMLPCTDASRIISSEAGMSMQVTGNTVDYTIVTTNDKPFSTDVMFVCEDEDGNQTCFNFVIEIPQVCPRLKNPKGAEKMLLNEKDLVKSEKNSIFITPNPVNNILYVNHKDFKDKPMNMEIIDQYGKLILSQELNDNIGKTRIDVSNIKSGIYFVRYIQNNKNIATQKIVIVK